jgi:hypothetical protein
VVRGGIDILRLIILGGAVVYAVDDRPGAAGLLAALGSVTVVARLVNLPRVYDLSLTAGMAHCRLRRDVGALRRVRAL